MTQEALNVMVTGGTGFVGFHTVRALVNAGHSVRLLVRSPEKMQRVFAPFGLENLPYIQGDITDETSVNHALKGCNAVVHSAALVSVHASDSEKVLNNNLLGTRLVLGGRGSAVFVAWFRCRAPPRCFAGALQASMSILLWARHCQVMVDPKSSVRNLCVSYRAKARLFIRPIRAASWGLTIQA